MPAWPSFMPGIALISLPCPIWAASSPRKNSWSVAPLFVTTKRTGAPAFTEMLAGSILSASVSLTMTSTAEAEEPPATGDAVAVEGAVVGVDVDPPEHAASATAMAAMSGRRYRRMVSSWQVRQRPR